MDIPSPMRKMPHYWFACPHCGHCEYRAYGNMEVRGLAEKRPQVEFRFWCPACAGYSLLEPPHREALLLLGIQIVLFIVLFSLFQGLGWWVVAICAAFGLAGQRVLIPLLSRLLRRYVPAP